MIIAIPIVIINNTGSIHDEHIISNIISSIEKANIIIEIGTLVVSLSNSYTSLYSSFRLSSAFFMFFISSELELYLLVNTYKVWLSLLYASLSLS